MAMTHAAQNIGTGLAVRLLALWKGRGMLRAKHERSLRVLESLSLGGRRQLQLIRCGDAQFLVGCGTDSVDCIVPVVASAHDQAVGGL